MENIKNKDMQFIFLGKDKIKLKLLVAKILQKIKLLVTEITILQKLLS